MLNIWRKYFLYEKKSQWEKRYREKKKIEIAGYFQAEDERDQKIVKSRKEE